MSALALCAKIAIGCDTSCYAITSAIAQVRGLIEELQEHLLENSKQPHTPSSASRVGTKGDSLVAAFRFPDKIASQCRAESINKIATSARRNPVTQTSSRLLKITLASPPLAAVCRACARKPMRGA